LVWLLTLIIGNILILSGSFCINEFFHTGKYYLALLGATQWAAVATWLIVMNDVLKLLS
jgi:hypothetical protein